LEEQLVQENNGLTTSSITAEQFLRQRLIRTSELTQKAPERDVQEDRETASISVYGWTWFNENRNAARTTAAKGDVGSLERRQFELEFGPGGDHDVAYSFALPASVPQVPVWMSLLARVRRGELQP
jgi:hypothetical protein